MESLVIIALLIFLVNFFLEGMKRSLKTLYKEYIKKGYYQTTKVYKKLSFYTIFFVFIIGVILNGDEFNIIVRDIIVVVVFYGLAILRLYYMENLILKEDKFIIISQLGRKKKEYNLKDIESLKYEEFMGRITARSIYMIRTLYMKLKNKEEKIEYMMPTSFLENKENFVFMLYLAIKDELETIPNLTKEDCNRIKEEIYLKKE